MPDQQPPARPEDRTPMTDTEIEAAYVIAPPRLNGPVPLAPYDPRWPEAYAALAARIGERPTPLPHRLDHAGSTSVPVRPELDVHAAVRGREERGGGGDPAPGGVRAAGGSRDPEAGCGCARNRTRTGTPVKGSEV